MRLLGTFSPTQAFRGQHSLHSRNGWPSHNKCLRMIPFRTFQDFSKLDVQRNLQITASREAVQHSTGHCVVIPGFLKGAPSYSGLAESLSLLGSSVEVVPISRLDWYPTLAGAPFRRLLDKIALAVARAYERHGRVTLVPDAAAALPPGRPGSHGAPIPSPSLFSGGREGGGGGERLAAVARRGP